MNSQSHDSLLSLSKRSVAPARALAVSCAAMLLTACAGFDAGRLNPGTWFGDEEVNPPTPLERIAEEVELAREWSASVGNGQGKIFNLITPSLDGEKLFAASEDGTVAAFSAADGDLQVLEAKPR